MNSTEKTLRRGWSTGACATAATKAALHGLFTGQSIEQVSITLPRGEQVSFALSACDIAADYAQAAVEKDAGDDPDVTHGAWIYAKVQRNTGLGIRFFAGDGVGTVTLPGLPIAPGEPAINPVPRQMMRTVVDELCTTHAQSPDIDITLSVPNGAQIARHTWNPRLGIVDGISILGTTGIVRPFSCSAWIHSIHRGIDVACALQRPHVAACTGATSEQAVQKYHPALTQTDFLDMGDFCGAVFKYLKKHPRPKLTIGSGFGKLCKLAYGERDLHSKRSQVNFAWLAQIAGELGANAQQQALCARANSALQVLQISQAAGIDIAAALAHYAQLEVSRQLGEQIKVQVLAISRDGRILAQAAHPHFERES